MTAQLKSRVLVREEKGFGAVSMKRMIFSFMGSGFVFFAMRLTPFARLNIPVTLLSMVIFFYFTGDRYGLPRWRWMLMNWRGHLLVQARKHPTHFTGQLCKILKWDAHHAVVLKGAEIFASAGVLQDDWSGLEILDTDDLEAGGFEVLADDVLVV